ncbi:uncharacterized protein L201_007548 [Kwoniella dendrophila CBS 6074]|uniref:Alpha-L-rhamnosidase n=1 Tax=Kwoniella dendrophila CBS 6074 TaxID=1295534 RepID=A0AAX4K631_9TREE
MATISTIHPTQLPSRFSCSDDRYNHLWDAGARTMQLCTAAKGSTPPLWQTTPQGALISATRAIKHSESFDWQDYTLSFDVTIHRAGCGWGVSMTNLQGYVFYINQVGYLRAGQPESERLKTDSISAVFGFTDENATSVENIYFKTAPLPKSIIINEMSSISTRMSKDGIVVSINGDKVYTIESSEFQSSPITQSSIPQGAFGFGPGPDALATYTNILATSNIDGKVLYQSNLDNQQDLVDFAAGTTTLDCLLDGGKRDRVVWGGDAAIMGPPVAYSTYDLDALKGTIDLLASHRGKDGRFAAQILPTFPAGPGVVQVSDDFFYRIRGHYFSLSYELYMIQTIYDAWMFGAITDNELKNLFPAVQGQLARVETFIDGKGLIFCDSNKARDAREYNYYDPPRLGHSTKLNAQYVASLKQIIEIAKYLGNHTAQATYQAQAERTADAVNQHLWNEKTGAYGITAASPDVIAQDANVYCVLSGLADCERSKVVLETLSRELSHPRGLLAFDRKSGYRESISNFVSGWHLFAAFQAGAKDHAKEILDKILVPTSLPNHPGFTGTLWELMLTDGSPGMGGFTFLAHGWSAAATAALPAYVVGVRPTTPRFKTFTVSPMSLGLAWASAVVATPFGKIEAEWRVHLNVFTLKVSAPHDLRGSANLREWGFEAGKSHHITINGGAKTSFVIENASDIQFTNDRVVYFKRIR